MENSNYLELKLFIIATNKEVAETLETLESLQHIEIFRELKKEILIKYESQTLITNS